VNAENGSVDETRRQLIASLETAQSGMKLASMLLAAAKEQLLAGKGNIDLTILPQVLDLAATFNIKPSDLFQGDNLEEATFFEKLYGSKARSLMEALVVAEKQGKYTPEILKETAEKYGFSF
jgi:hypothetical protein